MKQIIIILLVLAFSRNSFCQIVGGGGSDAQPKSQWLRPTVISSYFIIGTLISAYLCRIDTSKVNKKYLIGINGGFSACPWADFWGNGYNLNINLSRKLNKYISLCGVLGYSDYKEIYPDQTMIIRSDTIPTHSIGHASIISFELPLSIQFNPLVNSLTLDTKFGPGIYLINKFPSAPFPSQTLVPASGSSTSVGFNLENTIYYEFLTHFYIGVGHNLRVISDEITTWSFYLEMKYGF
jgi:hypothetical protein